MLTRVLFVVFGIILCITFAFMPTSHVVAQTMEGGYKIFKPSGPGPHPAVIFVSGCSGFAPSHAPKHYEQVAEKFQTKGYVVVFVDYIARRGLSNCIGITHSEISGDLIRATVWLKTQSFIDPARITAIGWAYGGGGLLTAVHEHKTEQLIFSRAIAYYPPCGHLWQWNPKVPVLMLLAGEDTVARYERCKDAVQGSATPNVVKIVIYLDALHCFDMSELPPRMYYEFGTIGYHPQAAAAAWEEVERFLQSGK